MKTLLLLCLFAVPCFGAEFLVRRADSGTMGDRGDIVQVYPDGMCKEAPATDSIYYIIKSPGLETMREYMNPLYTVNNETGNVQILKDRCFKILIDTLPFDNKQELTETYWTTISSETVKGHIYNKHLYRTIE